MKKHVGSCSGQDKFALSYADKGTWLEIGAYHPVYRSNTKLLEDNGWSGVSLEIDPKFEQMWKESGRDCTNYYTADALTFDYSSLENKHFTYLSLDIEPALLTLKALEAILEAGITFDCLTYEHDRQNEQVDGLKAQEKAFELLTEAGYTRIYKDVNVMGETNRPFEDWYEKND